MQLLLTPDTTASITFLADRITNSLSSNKKVLWFVTGGSNIAVDVQIMQRIPEALSNQLYIYLTDERYGDYGHKNSNWQQLLDAGFDAQQANTYPVLQTDNQSLEQTTALFASNLEYGFNETDVVIGFYGIGDDGHISGILPDSPAVNASGLATSYHGADDHIRISTTFPAIRRCDVAVVQALGQNKRQALQDLTTSIPIKQQPAQILKQIVESYVYNDQIGESV